MSNLRKAPPRAHALLGIVICWIAFACKIRFDENTLNAVTGADNEIHCGPGKVGERPRALYQFHASKSELKNCPISLSRVAMTDLSTGKSGLDPVVYLHGVDVNEKVCVYREIGSKEDLICEIGSQR